MSVRTAVKAVGVSTILVLTSGVSGLQQATPGDVELRRVRITVPGADGLRHQLLDEGYGADCNGHHHDHLDLVVTPAEEAALRLRFGDVEVLEVGRPFNDIQAERNKNAGELDGGPTGYPDLAAVNQQMNDAAAAFPAICEVVNLNQLVGVPQTFEGRDIFAVKISDNVGVDENEPQSLVVSCHHAREIVTPVIALKAIENLTTQYGIDPTITDLVNSTEIWVVPVWNPDGYNEVFVGNNLWRKNRRVFPGGVGVDLNRNYPQGWDNACGGSTSVTSDTYRGPVAASEPETQLMIALCLERRFSRIVDFHSFGSETLWSYACPSHPFDDFLQEEAAALSTAAGYSGDERPPSADGESYEWQLAQTGAHAFLMETHTEFQPDFASAQAEAAQVFGGILEILTRPVSVSGQVTDSVTGLPVEASITLLGVSFSAGETNGSGGPFGHYHQTLPAGTYQLEFAADDYGTQTHTVNVSASSAQVLDVALVPDAPPLVAYDFPNGLPSFVAPAGTLIDVMITELQAGGLVAGTEMFHYDAGAGVVSSSLAALGGDLYQASIPALDCGVALGFWFSVEDSAGNTITSPVGAPANAYAATVASGTGIVFEDNFEMFQGWLATNAGATAGNWQRGVPVNDPSWPNDPETDGDGSGQCYLTQNTTGNSDVDNGAVRLTSAVLDFSGGGISIDYLYFSRLSDTSGADALVLEISSNGDAGPWTEVARHDTDGGLLWRSHSVSQADLDSAGIAFTSTMKLRFTMNDANPQSIVEGGIDGLVVNGAVCDVDCPADVIADGVVNVLDLLDVLSAWGPCSGCPQDVNADDEVNVLDVLEILAEWGPC